MCVCVCVCVCVRGWLAQPEGSYSPGHARDEAAKELLGKSLSQAAARQGGLVYNHGTVQQVRAADGEWRGEREMERATKTA